MANIRSAKKRNRQVVRRASVNRTRLSRIRTFIKRAETALTNGNADAAREAIKEVEPALMRGAQKGVVHRNMASRKLSRLTARLKALEASA